LARLLSRDDRQCHVCWGINAGTGRSCRKKPDVAVTDIEKGEDGTTNSTAYCYFHFFTDVDHTQVMVDPVNVWNRDEE